MPAKSTTWPITQIVRILDGDTIDVLGMHASTLVLPFGLEARITVPVPFRIRLAGVNAAKLPTPAGRLAADFVKRWTAGATFVTVTTREHYKYGGPEYSPYAQFMADVTIGDLDLVEALLDHLLASYWDGTGARPNDKETHA